MTSGLKDVIIVGGGIIGCLTAYFLARQGVKATVLEADSVGSHASGFAFGEMGALEGAGIPDPLLDFSLWSFRRHASLSQELKEVSGVDNQYHSCDRILLAFDEETAARCHKNLQWQQRLEQFDVQWLDTAGVLQVDRRINPECLGGVHVQRAGAVEPYRHTLAAAQSAEKLGVEVRQRRVTGLLGRGGRCTGVTFGSGTLEADAVVLAMGPWSGETSSWCGFRIPIGPLKGQILRLQGLDRPVEVSIHYGGSYVSSKPDGLIWGGTTEEQEAGFDEQPTVWGRDKVMGDLLKMMPGIVDAQVVHQTACLRPLSEDGLPIVGKVPGWENLYLGTGAGRKGILWSTGMSEGLADLILSGRSDIPGMKFLDPARFTGE